MIRERVGFTVDAALFIANSDLNIASRLLRYNDLAREAETWRLLHACQDSDCDSPACRRTARAPGVLKKVWRLLGAWSSRLSEARGDSGAGR